MFNSRTFRAIARKLDTLGVDIVTIHADAGPDDLAITFHAVTFDRTNGHYLNITGAVAIDGARVYDESDPHVVVASDKDAGEDFAAAFGVFTMAVASTTV